LSVYSKGGVVAAAAAAGAVDATGTTVTGKSEAASRGAGVVPSPADALGGTAPATGRASSGRRYGRALSQCHELRKSKNEAIANPCQRDMGLSSATAAPHAFRSNGPV